MRLTFILLTINILSSCESHNTSIKKIERTVYEKDSVYSTTCGTYTSTTGGIDSKLMIAISSMKKSTRIDTVKLDKYIIYCLYFSNYKKIIKTYLPNQQLDNLIRLDGNVEGDETFELNWWLSKEEIINVVIPSSNFHK